mgnify:CR=1 FL=1
MRNDGVFSSCVCDAFELEFKTKLKGFRQGKLGFEHLSVCFSEIE